MIRAMHRTAARAAALTLLATLAAVGAPATAQAKPVKEILTARAGWDVNKTKVESGAATQQEMNLCTTAEVEGGAECQKGKANGGPGGVHFPRQLAVQEDSSSPYYGDLYVNDKFNGRIEILTPAGAFVATFGWEVNATKDAEPGATQAERNVCTAASGDACQAGVFGTAPGQFDNGGEGLAIDPQTGEVFIGEYSRVQRFSSQGTFELEVGRHVNQTSGANICTVAEEETKGVVCGPPPALSEEEIQNGITEHEALDMAQVQDGNAIAFGGSEDLLYVGEQGGRIQELETDGHFKLEVTSTFVKSNNGYITTLAVDGGGDVFFGYAIKGGAPQGQIVELGPGGEQLAVLEPRLRTPPETVYSVALRITALAVDPSGRLAVAETEEGYRTSSISSTFTITRGTLYTVAGGALHQVTEFAQPEAGALAFDAAGDMFASQLFAQELLFYEPVTVGEPLTGSGSVVCTAGVESGSDATLDCPLEGEINPWGVPQTEAWIEYGASVDLGSSTTRQAICGGTCGEAPVALTPAIMKNVIPSTHLYYRAAGADQLVKAPEQLTGETVRLSVPSVPPRAIGQPSASYVTPFSVVFAGELNAENSQSEYFFELAAGTQPLSQRCPKGIARESCAGVFASTAGHSGEYGAQQITLQARDLQPATTYRYRLGAVNEAGQAAVGQDGKSAPAEGSFTTAPAPAPSAQTAPASAIGASTATIAGTVNPDGQPATYSFQLAIEEGAATRFGTVFSGPAGEGAAPLAESLPLSGLQPGTTYAYRIVVQSAFGTAYGATETFTTQGLPDVLSEPSVLAMLVVPNIGFPTQTGGVRSKRLTMAQKLANALRACKHRPKRRRAVCMRNARKRYARGRKAARGPRGKGGAAKETLKSGA